MFELDYARHDPLTCLAPGLFRSLKRGERKKTKLDITYDFGKDETARFVGFEPLGADDMRVLQGLIAFAGPDGVILAPEPKTKIGNHLRLFLEAKFDAVDKNAMVVKARMYTLLKEIGLTDGADNIKMLKSSLLRMSNVTLLVKKGTRQASFNLLSFTFDEDDGRLFVALNPRVAEAISGLRSHTRIELAEIRSIKSDPARLIHQRLCGWINPAGVGRVTIDTLCSYIWPSETNDATMRQRRVTARKSLKEIEFLGWEVVEYVRGKFTIKRPAKAETMT